MNKDVYRKFDTSLLRQKRKNIYQVRPDVALALDKQQDGRLVNCGKLKSGDLIYVTNKKKVGDNIVFYFKAIPLVNTKYRDAVFNSSSDYFQPYNWYDNFYNFTKIDNENRKNKNYGVPFITGIGGCALGYFMAERFQKNKLHYILGFGVAGLLIGILMAKKDDYVNYDDKIIDELNSDNKLSVSKLQEIKDKLSNYNNKQKSAIFDYIKDVQLAKDEIKVVSDKDSKKLKERLEKIDKIYTDKYGSDNLMIFKNILSLK